MKIRISPTLLIAIGYFMFIIAARFDQAAMVAGVDFVEKFSPLVWAAILGAGLFASILISQASQLVVARVKKLIPKEVVLLPFGSDVSWKNLDVSQRSPSEALIATAGLMTHLGLGILFYTLFRNITHQAEQRFFYFYMGQLNLMLFAFNLVPAFPLLGGRMFRGLTPNKISHKTSTNVVSVLGMIFALGFAIFGIVLLNAFILLLAAFLYAYSKDERRSVRRVRNLNCKILKPHHSVTEVLDAFGQGFTVVAVVSESGALEGIIEQSKSELQLHVESSRVA